MNKTTTGSNALEKLFNGHLSKENRAEHIDWAMKTGSKSIMNHVLHLEEM